MHNNAYFNYKANHIISQYPILLSLTLRFGTEFYLNIREALNFNKFIIHKYAFTFKLKNKFRSIFNFKYNTNDSRINYCRRGGL